MRGLFVTGTDTGVGKTILAAAIAAGLTAQGERVRALKPVLTGLDESADPVWPRDHELLAGAAGLTRGEVALELFDPPVSPHLAAELAGRTLDGAVLAHRIAAAVAPGEVAVVEGVGGLLVPLAPDYDVRRLAAELGLPVVIAARPGLGTINHTRLTLEAARAGGLRVVAVVMTPWPEAPSAMERSNRQTVASLGAVPVETLPALPGPAVERLREAGAGLPLQRWLDGG